MKVNEKIKQNFVDFLAHQGITIDFKVALYPLYDSTDTYLDTCEMIERPAIDLITKAFKWESSNFDYADLKYHNKCWRKNLRKMEE